MVKQVTPPTRSPFTRAALVLAVIAGLATTRAQSSAPPLATTTIAGQTGVRGYKDGTGTSTAAANFFNPSGLAVDGSGNVYVADANNNTIRKITPAGVVTTLAGQAVDPGTLLPVAGGSSDGTGSAAHFSLGSSNIPGNVPFGPPTSSIIGSTSLGIDRSGNLYIADTLNDTVRMVTAAGSVTTIAGQVGSPGAVDSSGGAAQFSSPFAAAFDNTTGSIFIADSGKNTIRKVTTGGAVSTFAGRSGFAGSSDGTGTAAQFSNPSGIAVDPSGNVFVADTSNHTIRKITPSGVVTTFAGAAPNGATGTGAGSSDGFGAGARFNGPTGLATDASGNVYVADTGNDTIRMITASGAVSTIAGSPLLAGTTDGIGTGIRLNQPNGVAVDAAGNVYIADSLGQTIRKGVPFTTAPSIQIQSQPTPRTILLVGQTTVLSVVSNSIGISYQWQKNGVNIAGANNASFAIQAAQTSNSGSYTVVLNSGNTSVTSQVAQVDIFPAGSISNQVVIVTQPVASQTVTAGQSVTMSVVAVGDPDVPTYQWQLNGVAITGATSSSFTLASAQLTDAGAYTVAVKNSAVYPDGTPPASDGTPLAGTPLPPTISSTSNLTVNPGAPTPVTITSQPVSLAVSVGQQATFTVVATGSPTPTYQWLVNGNAIAGATNSSYVIAAAQLTDAGSYTVVATNSSNSVTSSAATLTVTALPVPVTIVTQPLPVTVNAGQPASFSVGATGTPTPTYQWQKNGANISGATNTTFTLASAQTSDAGNYSVVVTNSSGSVTSTSVALTVNVVAVKVSITASPQSLTVTAGGSATFSVTATGTAPLAYQWLKNGAQISGATNSTYTLSPVQLTDAGNYSVLVTNSLGSALSDVATLTVNPNIIAPSITSQPVSVSVNTGQNATFSVSATGTAPLAYQWKKNGVTITGATNSTYTITGAQLSDAGNYSVLISNTANSVTSNSAALTVTQAPFVGSRIINLSISTTLAPGETSFAMGAFVGGAGTSGTKALLARAGGPSLGQFGATNFLPDPQMDFRGANGLIASNDNWGGDPALSAAFAQVGAYGFVSSTSKDAAVLQTALPSGTTYNIVVSSAPNPVTTGTVLAELYDATPANAVFAITPRLTNVSVIKNIGNSLAAGIVISGTGKKTLLVRAIGPALAGFNVTGFLAAPRLEFFAAGGVSLAVNSGWGGTDALKSAFAQVSAFALPDPNSKDAALLITLDPGSYVAQVTGVGNTTGTALVEIYEMPSP